MMIGRHAESGIVIIKESIINPITFEYEPSYFMWDHNKIVYRTKSTEEVNQIDQMLKAKIPLIDIYNYFKL